MYFGGFSSNMYCKVTWIFCFQSVIHVYTISTTYCVLNLALFYNVVTITTQPMNVTVCLSLSTTANFTCVVDAGSTGITTVGWQILTGGFYAPVVGRARHMLDPSTLVTNTGTIITETLTITDVSLSDNGAKYQCRPRDDVISDVVTLTVIGINFFITSTHTYNFYYVYVVHMRYTIQFYCHVYEYMVCSYT